MHSVLRPSDSQNKALGEHSWPYAACKHTDPSTSLSFSSRNCSSIKRLQSKLGPSMKTFLLNHLFWSFQVILNPNSEHTGGGCLWHWKLVTVSTYPLMLPHCTPFKRFTGLLWGLQQYSMTSFTHNRSKTTPSSVQTGYSKGCRDRLKGFRAGVLVSLQLIK